MAYSQPVDDQGRPIVQESDFWTPNPGSAPSVTPAETSPDSQAKLSAATAANNGAAAPAPAPASSAPQTQGGSAAPQLPEFGMGSMNMPPAPTFDQPDDASLVSSQNDGLSADDQAVRSSASSIFGSDPGAPGGKYSGGYGRQANPLRESDVGKRFTGASKAGTAYGNAFDKEGLLGGGKNAQLAGGDNADPGQQPSDLLLQMLQLLGQQG